MSNVAERYTWPYSSNKTINPTKMPLPIVAFVYLTKIQQEAKIEGIEKIKLNKNFAVKGKYGFIGFVFLKYAVLPSLEKIVETTVEDAKIGILIKAILKAETITSPFKFVAIPAKVLSIKSNRIGAITYTPR